MDAAALPARRETVADLGRRGELAVGFKQVVSVHRAAVGVTPWRDPAAAPHIGEHETPGGSFGGGLGGVLAAGAMAGGVGSFWALQALGLGTGTDRQGPMASRRDPQPGRLTAAADDLSALTSAGPGPTVLAFVLCRTAGLVALEILNLGDPPTFVYRAAGPGALAEVNRALDDEGFQVTGPGDSPGRAPRAGLGQLLAGRAVHGGDWARQLDALLAG